MDCKGKRKIEVDYIGRFENIEYEWKKICELTKFPYSPLNHLKNWGVKDHYSNYYTDKNMILKVEKKYRNDLDYFNYKYKNI